MGYYINEVDGKPLGSNKKEELIKLGATVIGCPVNFSDVPNGKSLICVVNNYIFEAAGHAYSEREFEAFAEPDGRPRTWLLMDTEFVTKNFK